MDGRTDGWMDGYIDRYIDRWINKYLIFYAKSTANVVSERNQIYQTTGKLESNYETLPILSQDKFGGK